MSTGPVIILLFVGCLGSGLQENACNRSFEVYKNSNQDMLLAEKNFNRIYLDPIPDEAKFLAGTAYSLYNKGFMFNVYSGVILNVRDRGQGTILWRKDFP